MVFERNRSAAGGWGFNQPTQNLVDAFDVTDPRLSCTVYGIGYNNGILYGTPSGFPDRAGQMMTNYYSRKVATYDGDSGQDALLTGTTKAVFVIRYADILLMHAEAAYYLQREDEARQKSMKYADVPVNLPIVKDSLLEPPGNLFTQTLLPKFRILIAP